MTLSADRYAGAALRVLVLLLMPGAAMAQVSVNQGALDQLTPSAPKPAAKHPPAKPHAAASHAKAPEAKAAEKKPAAAKTALAPAATAPAAPARPPSFAPAAPPGATLAPLETPPARTVPPPPIPMLPDAVGSANKIPGGLRVSFGDGKADLNPDTVAALRTLAHQLVSDPGTDVNVYAYAAGSTDDPSTPRRLSLSRALAARAVLIGEGIQSTRIYVRALGATPSDGPPDRVDVTQVGTPPPK